MGDADRSGALSFEIRTGQRLERFSRLGTPAYLAESKLGLPGSYYAMVLDPDYPPRAKALRALKGVRQPGLTWLEEWSVLPWGPAGDAHRLICVFRQPNGEPLFDAKYSAILPIPERIVIEEFLRPTVEMLLALYRLGLSHGGIRPTNITRCRDQGRFVVGECVSLPPGADQPALFETVDRGATDPMARGEPTTSDDVYSLGMTVVAMLIGKHPVPDLDDKGVLRKRVEGSSFMMLSERHRLPYGMLDVLRGMLQDDSRDRWTLSDIDAWLNDGTIPQTKLHLPKSAGWPMEFFGTQYSTVRSLAYAIGRHADIEGAKEFLKSRKFRNWMVRGVDEERLLMSLEPLFSEREDINFDKMAEAVTMSCMVMNPYAPMHYKGLAINPTGMGTMLATNMENANTRGILMELAKSSLPLRWLGMQSDAEGYISTHKLLTKAQGLASRSGWGFGLERALYEMQPTARCMSPLLSRFLVYRVETILPALEQVAAAAKEPFLPVDRHLVSFVLSRRRDFSIGILDGIDSEDAFTKAQAALRFVAYLEEKVGSGPLPELTRMLGSMLQPGIDRILRPRRKQELQRKTDKAIEDGKLQALLDVFKQGGLFEKDQREFQDACLRWRVNHTQIMSAEQDEKLLTARSGEIGSRIAFFISICLSSLSLAGIMLFMMV
ncbi:MAG: hypothetical protein KKC98_16240 [Alphaproteobacteria bacterium]|nr:hypothetical protein [Alphaproteobacteria bacterium]